MKSDAKYKPETLVNELEDIDINEYLDNSIVKNAEFNNRIRSTLSSLSKVVGTKNLKVISENIGEE